MVDCGEGGKLVTYVELEFGCEAENKGNETAGTDLYSRILCKNECVHTHTYIGNDAMPQKLKPRISPT